MRFVRDLRLIPVVALAAAALFVLKVSAIVIEGGYTLIASRAALAQGLGDGASKANDMPPPAPLDDAARRAARRPDRRRPSLGAAIMLRTPTPEYTGSVAARRSPTRAAPAAARRRAEGAAPAAAAT